MSLQNIQIEETIAGVQPVTLESLVTTHFNRAYLVLNVFIEDPRTCLQYTEGIFRALDIDGDLSEKGVYRALVKQIRRMPKKLQALPGVPHEHVVCWLLKETSELKYAEIASLMGLTREQVKEIIAGVRMQLIS